MLKYDCISRYILAGSLVVVGVEPVKVHRDALDGLEALAWEQLKHIIDSMEQPQLQFALYQCDQVLLTLQILTKSVSL